MIRTCFGILKTNTRIILRTYNITFVKIVSNLSYSSTGTIGDIIVYIVL